MTVLLAVARGYYVPRGAREDGKGLDVVPQLLGNLLL